MPPSEDKSYIDDLKKSLYSRTVPDIQTRRKLRIDNEDTDVKTDWEHPKDNQGENVELNKRYISHSMSIFTKFFIFSLVFCLIAVGVGAYLFLNGSNLISADNIDITISGPVSIPGGEPVTFDIIATNKNNIGLQLVDMSVDFPDGTTDPADPSQTLKNYTKLEGNIPAGGSINESVKAIIFGEENMQKEITVTLTYGVSGSTSTFTKTKTYDVLLNSSPLSLSVSSFKEITSGQEFDMKIALTSNSQQTLKNIILKATYPFGFNFISSSLPVVGDKGTWSLGDIPPGGKKSLTIHGSLTGEDSDLRSFHFTVGAKSSSNSRVIGTQYTVAEQNITIMKPFISLNIDVDGNQGTADQVGQFGQTTHVAVRWFNNLSSIVSNVKITAKLSGSAYNRSSIVPDTGYFDSSTNSITWSQQTNSELASVGPGENGSVSFAIVPKDLSTSDHLVTNPTISISTSVSGDRTQETDVPSSVSSSATRNIVVSSNIALSGRVVRTVGPFTNTGPIPPKADQPTTYTIIWSVNNTTNSINNAVVKATLPPYVTWLNAIDPKDQDISYDKNTGQITWNIGTLGVNNSGSTLRREVDFQVSLKPSATQVGSAPTLVNQTTFTATDSFTGAQLQSAQDSVSTRFGTDPAYDQGDETVGN